MQEYTIGKNNLFNKWCWESWTATYKIIQLDHSLIPYTKVNLKWIKDLNVRPETIKFLEESVHCQFCFVCLLMQKTTKAKMNKSDYIKVLIKSFCTAKTTKNKRQSTEWEKISTNHISNKELTSKIYKGLIQLYITKIKNLIKKCIEDLNRYFPKDDI